MTVLEIHDMVPGGHYLAVDLKDVLRALQSSALKSLWRILQTGEFSEELFATGEGGIELERLAAAGERIFGDKLLNIAERTQQVIWGQFEGFRNEEAALPWITIVAFDSSWYEVHTEDNEALTLMRAAFVDVRARSDASSTE